MFVVDNILISDDLLDARFACNLGACKGACCVHGDAGAPLLPEERPILEAALPIVRKYLRPEALEVIEKDGVWEEVAPGHYATTCVGNAECVFVTYEHGVAKCALQRAFNEGKLDFPKPISCHLYPIRITSYGDVDVLNYEQIDLCEGGRKLGKRNDVLLSDFLREPLTRKYGAEWFALFQEIIEARRAVLLEEKEE